jgi:uncharacterized protein YegP (UPF0339 family)
MKSIRAFASALWIAGHSLVVLAPGGLVAMTATGCAMDTTVGSDEQDVTSGTGRFETYVGADGQHYFQLLAANGERILRSDAYKTLASAKKGITSAKKYGATEAQFQVLATDAGEAYFTLEATNGQLLALSDTYVSEANAERAVATAIQTLKTASTEAALASGPKFETFKGSSGSTYFRLRAKNGQIVLQSEGYSSKTSANKGIDSVKANGTDASNFQIAEGADGQHYFRLVAQNHQIIGRSEMYSSKSAAMSGAGAVRAILRELTGAGTITDDALRGEIEKAAEGLVYISESDYPFTYVQGAAPAGTPIDEALVRAELASYVEADPNADKPMEELVAMTKTWTEWKSAGHNCWDPDDPGMQVLCEKMRNLEQVLDSNLTEIQVIYFGANGSPGDVDGVGVSIFLVGRSPSGNLVGVRALAIWT